MAVPNAVRSGMTGCRRNPANRTIFRARAATLGPVLRAVVYDNRKCREHSMRVLRIAAVFAVLAGPAYAQMPNLNLIPETKSMTPEEKEAQEARDRAYKESLRKIPDAKGSTDPWGNVRSDAPKTAAPANAKTKNGSAH